MQIANDFRAYLFNSAAQWRELSKKPLYDHMGPVSILVATVVLVSRISEKHFTVTFVVFTCLTYPFYHRQIVYFLSIDVHEDVKLVSHVALYLLGVYSPLFAPWGFPLVVAIVYSSRAQWAEQRRMLETQKKQLGDSEASNKKLTAVNDLLLEKIKSAIRAHEELSGTKETELERVDEVRIAIEANESILNEVDACYKTAVEKLQTIAALFETAKTTEVGQLVTQVYEARQNFAFLKEQSELYEAKLKKSTSDLEEVNKRYEKLITEGTQKEEAFQQALAPLLSRLATLNNQ